MAFLFVKDNLTELISFIFLNMKKPTCFNKKLEGAIL